MPPPAAAAPNVYIFSSHGSSAGERQNDNGEITLSFSQQKSAFTSPLVIFYATMKVSPPAGGGGEFPFGRK